MWIKIEDKLPDFNGRVKVKYLDKGQIKEKEAWYETGNRRFEKGFSLLPKHVIANIIEWTRI